MYVLLHLNIFDVLSKLVTQKYLLCKSDWTKIPFQEEENGVKKKGCKWLFTTHTQTSLEEMVKRKKTFIFAYKQFLIISTGYCFGN